LRREELRTLEREIRLADALAQMRALHAESVAANERQRTERDLLNGILATSVAGILVVDTTGAIIFANHRAEQVLGLASNGLRERRYDSPAWRHTDLEGGPWPDAQQPFARVIATGEPVFDVCHGVEWPDGRRVLLSINGAPLRDAQGALSAVVFAVTDVSESVAAANSLRERDRQLEQITSAMPGVVFQYVLEADGREHFPFVTHFETIGLGIGAAELMVDASLAYDLLHPEDRLAFLASVRQSALNSARLSVRSSGPLLAQR
jgi:PAS domain S-box-containing protein